MGHIINYNECNGKHSLSVQQKPWHGLGQIVQQYPTSTEALQFAGLDYTVEKRELFTFENKNNSANTRKVETIINVPGYCATMRTDNNMVLGVIGKDYDVVQNIDAFAFFDSIIGGEGILYETAEALGGKEEKVFITAKLPGYIKVGSDDLIEKYLFLTTSHDGFGPITAAFTLVRIVCANTLNAALQNQTNSIKIRHTASARQRLEQAHHLMGINNKFSAELEEFLTSGLRYP